MNESKQITYSDHCAMILQVNVLTVPAERPMKCINKKGYEMPQKKYEESEISHIHTYIIIQSYAQR